MGEKGLALDADAIDALKKASDAARDSATDPTALLAGWSIEFINNTPDLANKWMEAYLNWRKVQEAHAGTQGTTAGGAQTSAAADGRPPTAPS
jgi:hypothetical protein